MRIAVMGAGAVGCYFGAFLQRAGYQVSFVGRGAHLSAMRERGLTLTGPRGDIALEPVEASDDPRAVAPADIVLLAVKLYDAEAAAEALRPMLKPEGICISLLNGVDGPERIAPILGPARVMGGAAFVSAVIAEPGVVRYTSAMSSIEFGPYQGAPSPLAEAFVEAATKSGFAARLGDMRGLLWHKFVGLATNAALTSIIRLPAGHLYSDADIRSVSQGMMREVMAVAAAAGVSLPDDVFDVHVKRLDSFPPSMYASMYFDLAKGRRIEAEHLSGYVVRKGRELGVPTPLHGFAYACLKPYLQGMPKEIAS
ncbi:ketopantoate reductase family protein [Desertibaculum subflavum]|uniref:ketopantoate reductase family protein n=1 Tax=Desertibaculum subflavum TaxID=2268458 RepID=UPI000E6727B9